MSRPIDPLPLTIPTGATARRPTWESLPDAVRALVEDRVGAAVVEADSQGSGFTPGFASRLLLADGRRVFAKAVSADRPWLLASYREEARKLTLLPQSVPAPTLQAQVEKEIDGLEWVVLVFDDVSGRPPQRPWSLDEAERVLDQVSRMSLDLTPAPIAAGQAWGTFAEEFAASPEEWATVVAEGHVSGRALEGAELAATAPSLCAGDTLCHADLRDDNVIVEPSGQVWVCDWNFPIVGPRWLDTVCLLMAMHGDGLDVEDLLDRSLVVSDTDREAVDSFLAVLVGYFAVASRRPSEPTSPYLRTHQRWYADVTLDWLSRRRGW